MQSKIVDIHPHIVSQDTVRYPVTPLGGKQSEWSKERSVTLEQLVDAMDEAGVDKAAIVHSSTTYGFNNDYVVDAVAAHPKRFTGVFSVNVTQPDAVERMRYWLSKGMTGMRIYARASSASRLPPMCTGMAKGSSSSRRLSGAIRAFVWSSTTWAGRRWRTAR